MLLKNMLDKFGRELKLGIYYKYLNIISMSILNFFRRLMGIETEFKETEPAVEEVVVVKEAAKKPGRPSKAKAYQDKQKPVGGKSL
jgi:hypothetical protein